MNGLDLTLDRTTFTDRSTIGNLSIGHEFICFILEDCVRTSKIPGVTAIPKGRYQVVITHSPRFGIDLPLLIDVPNFDGIRIHPGNKPEDTDGCLLPGLSKSADWVSDSRSAFLRVNSVIRDAIGRGKKVYITIQGDK